MNTIIAMNGVLCKVIFSKKNELRANDTTKFEENYGKVWNKRFYTSGRKRKPASAETEEIVVLAVEESTMESTNGMCSCMLYGRNMEHSAKKIS